MNLKQFKNAQVISFTKATYCRFHSRKRLFSSRKQFYRNFADTPHNFENQGRFSGSGFNSGFYFASSWRVALSEILFYNPKLSLSEFTPAACLRSLKRMGQDKVLMHIQLDANEILDLTDGDNVRLFIEHGSIGGEIFREPKLKMDYLPYVMSTKQGGNSITDLIGYDANKSGFNGLIFPSVRALQIPESRHTQIIQRANIPFRYSLSDFRKIPIADLFMEADYMASQLQEDHNLVVFSGATLCRMIKKYSVSIDPDSLRWIRNPYYGLTSQELESIRLRERRKLRFKYKEALEAGLISDQEIEDEFELPELITVRSNPEKQILPDW